METSTLLTLGGAAIICCAWGAATPARCAQQLANKQPCERTMLLLLGAVVALMSLCTAYNNGLGATPQVRSPAFMLPSAYAALALHAR
jgi:hypothetical protein